MARRGIAVIQSAVDKELAFRVQKLQALCDKWADKKEDRKDRSRQVRAEKLLKLMCKGEK